MTQHSQDERERWRDAAAGIAILVILILIVFWWMQPPAATSSRTAPTPSPTIIPDAFLLLKDDRVPVAQISYVINESAEAIRYSVTVRAPLNQTLSNMTLLAVFPQEVLATQLEFTQVPAGESTYLFDSPVIRAQTLSIPAGEKAILSVRTRINVTRTQAAAPVFLLANTQAMKDLQSSVENTSFLLLLASTISAHPLGFQESKLFSSFASQSLLSHSQDDASVLLIAASSLSNVGTLPPVAKDHALQAMHELLLGALATDEVSTAQRVGNTALYVALINRLHALYQNDLITQEQLTDTIRSLNAALLSEEEPLWKKFSQSQRMVEEEEARTRQGKQSNPQLTPTPVRGSDDPSSLFPTLPTSIEITLSETIPVNSTVITLISPTDIGYPLARFEGEAADLLSFSPRKLGTLTEVEIIADINRLQLQNGIVPHDAFSARLVLSYFSLTSQERSIPITIFIGPHHNLQLLAEQYGIEFGESDPTVGEALAEIERAQACNPLAGVSLDSFEGRVQDALYCVVSPNQRISSPFGPRHIAGCSACSRFHQGIDIAVPVGTPLYAPADGVVVQEFRDSMCGWGLKIDHGTDETGSTLATGYCHLSQFVSRRGQKVSRGQIIGYSGGQRGAPRSGTSQGPHLHFIVYRGTHKIDPLPYYRSCTLTQSPTTSTTLPPSTTSTTLGESEQMHSPPPSFDQAYAQALDANNCVQDYSALVNAAGGTRMLSVGAPLSPRSDACRPFVQTVHARLQESGLLSHGVSTEFVIALIAQESGCNPSPANGQGLMQVVRCAKDRCTLQENIERGFKQHLIPAYVFGRKHGLTGETLLRLMGLYYNRGSGTASDAVRLMKQGVPPLQAMHQACLQHFSSALCQKTGYGAYYYDAVQQRCEQLYGAKCSTNVD